MDSSKLIFIVSQPRSGSTLLQAILSNNCAVATVSEPWLLLPFLSYENPGISRGSYNSNLAAIAIKEFKSKVGIQEFNDDLAAFLLKQYQRVATDENQFVLDKTPRYYEILDEIVHLFPDAKIIILKRNPFAVLASIITTWKNDNLQKLLAYNRDILFAPKLLNDFSIKHSNNQNVKTIKYEDVILEPLDTIKSLYDWLGLPFEESVLSYAKNNKYKGVAGDPTGVHNNSNPNKAHLTMWEETFKDKYWKDFFIGYSNYLTPNFLQEYGEYDVVRPKKTQIFTTFEERSAWNFDEFQIPLLKLVKNNLLRRMKFLKH